ncbi:MAG: MutS-related protein [Lutibacter sp.]
MNIKETMQFVEFNKFYSEYVPLTPYGLLNKNKYTVFSDKEILNNIYNSIEKTVHFINENSFKSAKIENHFKRIALLNSLERRNFDSSDIFLVKKLLVNFKGITKLLNETIKDDLQISFSSNELLDFLTPDGENKETFYLSSSYSKELGIVRKQISEKDKALTEIKKERLHQILEELKLDFRFRDFIVVPENVVNSFNTELVFKEVYDKTSLLVKPILPKEFFEIHKEKESLLEEEHLLEQNALKIISEKILAEKELLKNYINKIEFLDTLFAKARLAIRYQMTKPVLDKKGENIEIINGQYLPLANKCVEMGTVYTPLNAKFDTKTIVITGSNMGGKTILLKTIGFMQVLTQMGFWVPAKKFKSLVFKNISYIGEDLSEKVEGLSSFGFEIYNLTKAIKDLDSNTLLLIDEFAKTTNSIEAKAIIGAMLKSFSQKEKVSSFVSTHFMELPEFDKVSFYKMKGLDYSAYQKYYNKEKQYSLRERIKLINTFMQYEIIKTSSKDRTYDAIKIADILGLNDEIIGYTKAYLSGNYD